MASVTVTVMVAVLLALTGCGGDDSLALAGVVTVVCLVLGVSLAGLVVRTRLPGRRVWGVLVVVPFAVPSYVAAFAWLSMFSRFGGFSARRWC